MPRAVTAPDLPLRPRRGFRRDAAAHYVGVGPSKFDELVRDGRMPKPFRVDGCVLWDIRDLDAAFDELKNATPGDDGWGDFDEPDHAPLRA